MKVLITGSTGFIGARLATRCHEAGDHVVALGLTNTPMETFRRDQLQMLGIEVIALPLGDTEALSRHMRGCQVIYHLAAAQHEANVPPRHFYDVNVLGTLSMLDASIRSGVGTFVHGSTVGVYGAVLKGELSENTPTHPDNIYGKTKLQGEQLALEYTGRLSVAVMRISETYGPGDGRLLKLFKAIDRRRFFLIGKGLNVHQPIYVDDLIQALLAAAARPEAVGNPILVAGRDRVTTGQMCRIIAEVLGVPPPTLRAPMWPFWLAAVVMENTLSPLGIQPPLHRRRLDFFRNSFSFNHTMSDRLLAFHPRPISAPAFGSR
ncbi:MAG: NAD-dependent epimerase/dehydratase family protein, partial [Acidobacteriota bacterium]